MKITVIGAGNVGACAAQMIAVKELANEVWLLDVNDGVAKGKALDMYETMPILGTDSRIYGTSDYAETANSDIIVMTAGLARKPGMSRDDLMVKNAGIVSDCISQAVKHSPNAYLIIVSNPLDVMTYVALKVSGLPRHKVMGMAGILDTARYNSFISMETGYSMKDIQSQLLGGHGDTMVPLPRFTTVGGIPVTDLIPQERLDAIVTRAKNGGIEIVNYLQTGSAYYAPGTAAVEMCEAIIKDQKRILPCTVMLDGEYGYNDVCLGVPIVLGKNGIEKIIELNLNADEKALLDDSQGHVKKTIDDAKAMLNMN
ncbi:MAG: malate dehydrogenase [Candidatus Kapaibacteriota bacterium]